MQLNANLPVRKAIPLHLHADYQLAEIIAAMGVVDSKSTRLVRPPGRRLLARTLPQRRLLHRPRQNRKGLLADHHVPRVGLNAEGATRVPRSQLHCCQLVDAAPMGTHERNMEIEDSTQFNKCERGAHFYQRRKAAAGFPQPHGLDDGGLSFLNFPLTPYRGTHEEKHP